MNVYGKVVLDIGTVRIWVSRVNGNFKKEETDLSNRFHSGRSAAAVNDDKAEQVYTLITADRRIIITKH